jgi:hypothetical protein
MSWLSAVWDWSAAHVATGLVGSGLAAAFERSGASIATGADSGATTMIGPYSETPGRVRSHREPAGRLPPCSDRGAAIPRR